MVPLISLLGAWTLWQVGFVIIKWLQQARIPPCPQTGLDQTHCPCFNRRHASSRTRCLAMPVRLITSVKRYLPYQSMATCLLATLCATFFEKYTATEKILAFFSWQFLLTVAINVRAQACLITKHHHRPPVANNWCCAVSSFEFSCRPRIACCGLGVLFLDGQTSFIIEVWMMMPRHPIDVAVKWGTADCANLLFSKFQRCANVAHPLTNASISQLT